MSIFQKSIVDKYLTTLDSDLIDNAYQSYKQVYSEQKIKRIKTLKEEQYQSGFLKDIFGSVLGYTIDPELGYNIELEKKNETNSKKADGAIVKDEKVLGVIELKSNSTKNLESIKDQAFGYKNNHKGCKYVISSNFHKLRFYVDDATDYEEFDLYNLDKETFKKFYLFLRKEGLLDKNVPKLLKEETRFHEENISKQLYKDYSVFKNKFFENIVKNNPHHDKLLLFKKSQKFLDRILFILFAEDKELVPINTISRIVENWVLADDLLYKPLYELFTKLFEHLNVGHTYKDGYEIPAYNGGLFSPDEILDNLKVDDEILKDDLLILSKYDFNTDVDVNILGHIFEHSLNEIEEIEAELKGEKADKSKGKRKKDGVFYTPKFITKYIVDNTVGKLCASKKKELCLDVDIYVKDFQKSNGSVNAKGKVLFKTLEFYKDWLLQLKILDPACGSGAFLNQALTFLIEEHKNIDDLISELTNAPLRIFDTDKSILENNIFGVDINDESVEIAKLSLWLRTAQQGRKLSNLNNNIKCGNSLIDDPSVAGDKFFNWKNEYPEIFKNGGFDVVIGNPPYLRKQGLMEHYPEMCKYYEENFISSTGNYDIYALFMEKSFSLINQKGIVSFILPHKFLISDFGRGIRQFFVDNNAVSELIHFGSEMVFQDAATYTCIINLTKNEKQILRFNHLKPTELFDGVNFSDLPYSRFSNEQWILTGNKVNEVLEKINYQPLQLKDIFARFVQGIITGKDAVFCVKGVIKGEFLNFIDEQGIQHNIEKAILKPHLRGEDINKFKNLRNNEWLIFPYNIINGKAELITAFELKSKYPNTLNYLKCYEDILRQREKGKFNNESWYQYSRNQAISVLEQSKIITPEFCFGGSMTLDENNFYHNSKCHSLILKENTGFTYKSILPFINSSLFWFYLSNTGNVLRGGYIGVKRKVLEPFSIPKPESLEIDKLEFYADLMLDIKRQHQLISNNFIKYFKSQYKLQKLSKKLQKWYNLDFLEFILEINKSIKKVKGDELDEKAQFRLMSLFEEQQLEAISLSDKIDRTDKEINQMVYDLYALTEEEIKIVEES